jgi:FixJ family two-component response regulator
MDSRSSAPFVVIVDDDASICRSLKRLLKTHGIAAETFTSSRIFIEVMENLPSFEADCVILDMHMPGLDGLEVYRRLARMRPRMRVVFLTSTYEPAHYREALALGALAFFRKPLQYELDLLISTLRTLLELDTHDQT